MSIEGQPYRFLPMGLSDAPAEDFAFPGACSQLVNLIPAPAAKGLWQARPAAVKVGTLPTPQFAAAAPISCMIVVGNYVFGMAKGGTLSAYDVPFCFNLLLGTFTTITGFNSSNLPTFAPSSGAWTPPQMTVVGTRVTIVHPGYDGITNFVGWINISNLSSPTYTAGNTTINALSSRPIAVAQFNQRAWYMLSPLTGQPSILATDVLDPTKATNATYALTFGDNTPLNGFGYVSLQSPLTGGVTSALLVFKGTSNIIQIVGDFTTSITANPLNVPTGTLAVNTVAVTPLGTMFMSPEGIRTINTAGQVSPPIGVNGQGVVMPFLNALVPSRAALAATGSVMRVSLQNGAATGSPYQEYWYDLNLQVWSGPHSFPAALICPWKNTFIMTPVSAPGTLWQSDTQQSGASVFTENAIPLNFTMQTALFASTGLNRVNLNEGWIRIAAYAGMPAPAAAIVDQNGVVLNSTTLAAGGSVYYWGLNNWGTHVWLGTANGLVQNPLYWTAPVVLNEGALRISGLSGAGFSLGDIFGRAEPVEFLASKITPNSTGGYV